MFYINLTEFCKLDRMHYALLSTTILYLSVVIDRPVYPFIIVLLNVSLLLCLHKHDGFCGTAVSKKQLHDSTKAYIIN